MAVKNKKCQEIKNIDWVSSSFIDSFGFNTGQYLDNTFMEEIEKNVEFHNINNENATSSPVIKKAKFDDNNLNDVNFK